MYLPGSKNQHVDSAFTVWKLTQLRNVFLVTSTLHSLVSLELLVYVSCRLELQSETLKKSHHTIHSNFSWKERAIFFLASNSFLEKEAITLKKPLAPRIRSNLPNWFLKASAKIYGGSARTVINELKLLECYFSASGISLRLGEAEMKIYK